MVAICNKGVAKQPLICYSFIMQAYQKRKHTKRTEYYKKWYYALKDAGICIACRTAKAKGGHILCAKCHEAKRQYHAQKRKELKKLAIEHYGGRCSCCSENNTQFLTIDHINGGGNAHRRKIGKASVVLHRWLVENNYPRGFQILCFNCNIGRSFNKGICPHKRNACSI